MRGVDLLAAHDDVDSKQIHAAGRDVKGLWVLLAMAVDSRLRAIWLDRTPHSLSSAMDGPLNTNLLDAMVPGFLLHWDLSDLVTAAARPVLWTDPTNWMGQIVAAGDRFRYRSAGQGDEEFLRALVTSR